MKTTQQVLSQLQSGANRLEFFNKPGLVVLTTSPAFANKWLMKRLHRFKEDNPSLEPWIYTTYDQFELEHAEVDLAVWHGSGDWAGVEVTKLFDDLVVPLYAPKLLEQGQKIESPEQLGEYPLIHVEQVERQEDWYAWFSMMGCPEVATVKGYNFNDTSLAIDFALEGHGLVLASKVLAQPYIDSGQLVQPFEEGLYTSMGYYLVHHPEKRQSEHIEKMRLWLLQQAGLTDPSDSE